ncbi:hypothetical protein [Treponema endosymbiont of Eucomonympha sp.]|uniref:hypothetical protein n=1 Tax=Treponema endosymbiont of Eucomonympha sp. TaxID=1580831 RepID=UPI000750E892|nr:hypothetical protein [Treponema endosymbiont of Eucomonympha sp.]
MAAKKLPKSNKGIKELDAVFAPKLAEIKKNLNDAVIGQKHASEMLGEDYAEGLDKIVENTDILAMYAIQAACFFHPAGSGGFSPESVAAAIDHVVAKLEYPRGISTVIRHGICVELVSVLKSTTEGIVETESDRERLKGLFRDIAEHYRSEFGDKRTELVLSRLEEQMGK